MVGTGPPPLLRGPVTMSQYPAPLAVIEEIQALWSAKTEDTESE